MTASDTEAATRSGTARLFPSLGFFGGNAADGLAIPLDGPVGRIVLRVPEDVTGSLDLLGIQLVHEESAVPVVPDDRHVRQSGFPEDHDADADPFALQRIRTRVDRGSWWMVRFDQPLHADVLRVYNRKDRFGYRVRRLIVDVAAPNGPWRRAATVGADDDVDRLAALVGRLTGIDVRPETCADEEVDARRGAMMRALADRALREPLSDSLDDVRRLLALVPTGHGQAPPAFTDDEWVVLAHLLAAQFALAQRTPTSFASFGFGLGTRRELDRLYHELNRVAPVLGLPPLVLTRHGVRRSSALRVEAEDYLALVDRARADFSDLGLPLLLGYGALLGVVREGDFLEHDDDVDLLYPIRARGRRQARPQIDALCAQLDERGWLVWRNPSVRALNFHVIDAETGRRLDLFPVLTRKTKVRLHMERMRLRKIPRDVVLPAGTRRFRGHTIEVPRDPEGFLRARYGPSWKTADPYDDWPWPLDDSRVDGCGG